VKRRGRKGGGVGKPDARTLLVDAAMREQPTPRKVLRAKRHGADLGRKTL